MTKYNSKLVREMGDWVAENGLMEYGGADLKDFCARFGITQETYYAWSHGKSEFSESIKKGKEKFRESASKRFFLSIAKAAEGYTLELESGDRIVQKHFPPSVAACIFLLTNMDPVRYRNTQSHDVTVKEKAVGMMSEREIREEIRRLRKEDSHGWKNEE